MHREILYNDIYSWDNEPATNTLEVHIHNLRDKVGKSRIRTVRGFGYMLVDNAGDRITLGFFWSVKTDYASSALLLTIGAILAVCQLISVFWLWHESQEQIQLLVASAVEGHNNQKHIEHEVREAVASLLIPSLLIIGLALYISLLAVKKITKPLSRLQLELESRTPDNLQPITLKESVPEVTAVTTAINQLVSRLNLTLDRERLFTADVAHELAHAAGRAASAPGAFWRKCTALAWTR